MSITMQRAAAFGTGVVGLLCAAHAFASVDELRSWLFASSQSSSTLAASLPDPAATALLYVAIFGAATASAVAAFRRAQAAERAVGCGYLTPAAAAAAATHRGYGEAAGPIYNARAVHGGFASMPVGAVAPGPAVTATTIDKKFVRRPFASAPRARPLATTGAAAVTTMSAETGGNQNQSNSNSRWGKRQQRAARAAPSHPRLGNPARFIMRPLRAATATASPPVTPGSGPLAEHPAYEIVESQHIAEVAARATLYRHKTTGAQILSMEKADTNKVFGITFRTPVDDSMGIPHILEHSVLCGSRKYPTKDPFVELLKGSLQTFLNAFTYPDRTCYPVASQNTKDFYNLVNVYLDAVLHPRAIDNPLVLKQEGCHLEMDEADSGLTYKGVVFNEMKGVYSQPSALLNRLEQQTLFPDNTYVHDSGGDPVEIPSLTFDRFKAFHGRYYHPANSRIFFYGDDDPLERLRLLDEYLCEFGPLPDAPDKSKVEWQKLKTKPWRTEGAFPVTDDQESKRFVSVNWVLNDAPLSDRDAMAIEVLDDLLMGSQAAVLRKELTDSAIGDAVIGGGLSNELKQNTFSVGLKGVADSSESTAKVEKLVMDTLKRVGKEGFPSDAIESSMNRFEFNLREFNVGGFPKGLALMLMSMREWVYDRDALSALKFEAPLAELKADLAAGKPVFEELIERLLVGNGHRATVTLVPDTKLEAAIQEREKSELEAKLEAMVESDVADVVAATEELKRVQQEEDTEEDKAKLPSLKLSDIDPKEKRIPCEVETRGDGSRVITHDISTSGILYADLCIDVASAVDIDDLPYLSLLTRMMTEVGTDDLDRVAFDRYVGSRLGGLSATLSMMEPVATNKKHETLVNDPEAILPFLFVRGKATVDRAADLFDIFEKVMRDAKLDQRQRVTEMLRQSRSQLESALVAAGHSYASMSIGARMSLGGYLQERLSGVTMLSTIDSLLADVSTDEGWATLLARLEHVRDQVLNLPKSTVTLNLTGDQDGVLDATRTHVDNFLDNQIPLAASAGATAAGPSRVPAWAETWRESLKSGQGEGAAEGPLRDGIVVPTQVNYVVKGGTMYRPGDRIKGSTAVVEGYLRTGYLWEQVRVVGGAYGAMTMMSRRQGSIRLASYRDPNLKDTLDVYDAAGSYLTDRKLSKEELQQAIIGTIGDLDSPLSPDQQGFESLREVLTGDTFERQQKVRDEVLGTTAADFVDFGKRLRAALVEDPQSHIAVVGSDAAMNASAAAGVELIKRNVLQAPSGGNAGGPNATVASDTQASITRKTFLLPATAGSARRGVQNHRRQLVASSKGRLAVNLPHRCPSGL